MTIPKQSPQINYLSQSAGAMKYILLNPAHDIWIISNAGAPAAGDGNGWIGTGSLCIDDVNGKLYQQTGTLAATVWTLFDAASGTTVLFPSASGIVAHSGGGGTSATQLTAQFNRISTVAAAADSVKLPPAVAGLLAILSNDGANPMAVYPNGTDQIEDSTNPVTQLAGQDQIYVCEVAGKWYTVGGSLLQVAGPLTAHSGGGQGSATPLPSQANLVGTVAASGDSVALPSAVPGLAITVVNGGANAMQVFGAGTDTVNAVATAVGVSQIAGSTVVYTCIVAGAWTTDGGIGGGYAGQYPTLSYKDGLIAHSGGGKGSALPLPAVLNRLATVALAGDSVLLPLAVAGMSIVVINDGVAAAQVFGAGTDTIDGIATGTGVALTQAKRAIFYCVTTGAWQSLAGAKTT